MKFALIVALTAPMVAGSESGSGADTGSEEDVTLSADSFVAYPPYSGNEGLNFAVSGAVTQMVTVGTTQTFDYSFTGLDANCSSGAGPRANSCGIHIHSGMTCSYHDSVGGHYFTGAVTSDPWASVVYAGTDGTASGTLSVTTGGTAGEVAGRAFIVHSYSGARVACALLEESTTPPVPSADDDDGGWTHTDTIIISVVLCLLAAVGLVVAVVLFRRRQTPERPVSSGAKIYEEARKTRATEGRMSQGRGSQMENGLIARAAI